MAACLRPLATALALTLCAPLAALSTAQAQPASAARAQPADAAQARGAWAGQYRYEWTGGRTAGGSGIAVTYTLRVTPQACQLDISGFQSDEHILCEAGADAGNLWIRFRSYADGRTVNRFNVAQYKPGEALFRLRRQGQGAPVTEWQSLFPGESRPQPGVRFRKV
jgi:hypothetical protein